MNDGTSGFRRLAYKLNAFLKANLLGARGTSSSLRADQIFNNNNNYNNESNPLLHNDFLEILAILPNLPC